MTIRWLLTTVACWLLSLSYAQQVIIVKKGDATSLLEAVAQANKQNADKDSKQLYILIPDGFYDLGQKVLTTITGHHIALIGQSMQGTIIQNKPDTKNEGISKTAIFLNRGTNNYLQDLTLKNALDYYAAGAAGRAVTLQDKGTRTICNRVCMLSYQDTYYSDTEDGQYYFQDSEIHGTVDFICGAGDVWFERCRVVTEKRTREGRGRNVIVAPRTSKTQWGYVFNRCTVENRMSNFQWARAWHTKPRCIWLYTTLMSPEKLLTTRFDSNCMRTLDLTFKEYGTMDAQGRNITPKTNVVTFRLKQKNKVGENEVEQERMRDIETIMTDTEATQYTTDNVFGPWQPDRQLRRIERQAKKLMERL